MVELAKEIRMHDPSYGIAYITFNTNTSLAELPVHDPIGELCARIAFAAFKDRSDPSDEKRRFYSFCEETKINPSWVADWLETGKCILFVEELNLLQDSIGPNLAAFLERHFLVHSGRGLVFSSHVASFSDKLIDFMSSPSNRIVITRPLPIIPSLIGARQLFSIPDLSAQDAMFLGFIPGLIVERKMNRQPTRCRK
jgi:hypothetical protein